MLFRSGCRYNGVTCKGGQRKSWWHQSLYLAKCGLTHLSVSIEDRQVLKNLLEIRLSAQSLKLTKLNTNTNKNEAINRGFSTSLPKNVNFSRNCMARASSTVHRLNNGAGVSLIKKLESVGSPITKGGLVAKAVYHMQTASRYHTTRNRLIGTKIQKKYNKIRQIQTYLRAKYTQKIKPDYHKGQLDPHNTQDSPYVHAYSLRRRGRPRAEHNEHAYFKPLHHV